MAGNWNVLSHAGIDLEPLQIWILRERSHRNSFIELGILQTPHQTVSVQALRNTRRSRRLRMDESGPVFFLPFSNCSQRYR